MKVTFQATDIQLTVETDMGTVAYEHSAKELKIAVDTNEITMCLLELLSSARIIRREVKQ